MSFDNNNNIIHDNIFLEKEIESHLDDKTVFIFIKVRVVLNLKINSFF